MTKEEEGAKIEAICARRGLRVPQNDADSVAWKALAMSEVAEHEPEFQERGEAGRPLEMPTLIAFSYFLLVSEAMAHGKKIRPVCKFLCEVHPVYRRRLKKYKSNNSQRTSRSEWLSSETLRQKVAYFRLNREKLIKDPKFREELLGPLADMAETLADYAGLLSNPEKLASLPEPLKTALCRMAKDFNGDVAWLRYLTDAIDKYLGEEWIEAVDKYLAEVEDSTVEKILGEN